MAELQDNQKDSLISNLVRNIDFKLRSLFNIKAIYSKLFATGNKIAKPRVEVTKDGIKAYDNNGNLIFNLVIDINNTLSLNTNGPLTITGGSIEVDHTRPSPETGEYVVMARGSVLGREKPELLSVSAEPRYQEKIIASLVKTGLELARKKEYDFVEALEVPDRALPFLNSSDNMLDLRYTFSQR